MILINAFSIGVPELISEIQQQGIKVGIVSSASKKELDKAVLELPFMQGLPIVSRNDVNELKPSAEPILSGLLKINTKPKNTLYVGDFHTDIIAGKAANTMTCAIIGEFPEISKTGLEGYDPDIIINKTRDLKDFLIA